tara:strand:- start:3833 stop:4243 length:411 start_codon:yes stop_codon:yes gene_type:complete
MSKVESFLLVSGAALGTYFIYSQMKGTAGQASGYLKKMETGVEAKWSAFDTWAVHEVDEASPHHKQLDTPTAREAPTGGRATVSQRPVSQSPVSQSLAPRASPPVSIEGVLKQFGKAQEIMAPVYGKAMKIGKTPS